MGLLDIVQAGVITGKDVKKVYSHRQSLAQCRYRSFRKGGGVKSEIIELDKYAYNVITGQVIIGRIISTFIKENYYVSKIDLFSFFCFCAEHSRQRIGWSGSALEA